MDHLHYSLLNTFSAQPLDRVAHGRKNADWLDKQSSNTQSEYLVLHGHQVVTIDHIPLILSYVQFHALDLSVTPALLGLKKTDNTPVFLINVTTPEDELSSLFQALFSNESTKNTLVKCHPLREIVKQLDSEIAAMYSYATILNHWHITTRFCTRCGSSLEIKEGGSLKHCTSEICGHIEYPRINPAVIMRITKDDKILLSRQQGWPDNMYSVLAGFVEVGETLEHTVEREVMEEVNIQVKNINYHSSQPWPFPNSMMLGYTAEACSFEFELDQDDIEDAMWLTAEEMKSKMADGSLSPSSEISISRSLINDWFESQAGISIKEFQATLSKL